MKAPLFNPFKIARMFDKPIATSVMTTLLLAFSAAWAVTGPEIIAATGISSGLCVTLGTTDGSMESSLEGSGKMLVQGLTMDRAACDASRAVIKAGKMYGLVSVRTVKSYGALPYAENLVNLLVADIDGLGTAAPSEAEILRVLVPKGVAYLKKGGQWTKVVKPQPAGVDDWTHYDRGPDGNPVSSDKLAGPIMSMKFTSWFRKNASQQRNGVRTTGGVMVHEARAPGIYQALIGRDAYNGLARWMLHNNHKSPQGMFTTVLSEKYVFTSFVLDNTGKKPLKALDPLTGKIVRNFTNGGLLDGSSVHWWARLMHVIHVNGVLYQTSQNTLYALNAETGALLWKYTEPGVQRLFYPAYSESEKKLFVAGCTSNFYCCPQWGAELASIIALDPSKQEKLAWRNKEVAGKSAGQLIYNEGHLVFFTAPSISRKATPHKDWTHVGVIRTSDGKLLWSKSHQTEDNPAQRVKPHMALVRDGSVYLLGTEGSGIARYDLAKGTLESSWVPNLSAQQCIRARGTQEYLFPGMAVYVDKDGKYYYQPMSADLTSVSLFPANGMQYLFPDGCQCKLKLQTMSAYSSASVGIPVADASRLEKGAATLPKRTAVSASLGEGLAKVTLSPAYSRSPVNTESPIRDEWVNNDILPYPETKSASFNGMIYISVVNEHRLECRQGGQVAWSHTAGGRITSPPVIQDGMCWFGSHDGYVYCVRADDGKRVWRFLAAYNTRQMVAWGQLESAWPVYGLILHDGQLCFSAGRSSELQGGIIVYGLDPKTGEMMWRHNIVNKREWCPQDGKCYVKAPGRVVNDVLQASGSNLTLPGVTINPKEQKIIPVSAKRDAGDLQKDPGPWFWIGHRSVQADFGTVKTIWATLDITDLKGRKIHSDKLSAKGLCVFKLPVLKPGNYVVEVKGDGRAGRRIIAMER